MDFLHKDAKPILEGEKQVGWRVESRDFTFDAIPNPEGGVSTYVEWGDDQGGDMAGHEDMSDAKRWLDTLLQASRR